MHTVIQDAEAIQLFQLADTHPKCQQLQYDSGGETGHQAVAGLGQIDVTPAVV